jgi:hypothetical protein
MEGTISPNTENFFLVSWFENIGRTPAILIEHMDGVVIVAPRHFPVPINPDDPPAFGAARHSKFPTGVAIGPQLHYEVRENMLPKPMEEDAWYEAAENNGRRHGIFIHGFMKYADIFGGKYVMGYCAFFDLVGNRFVLLGGPEHNYFRKEDC